MRTRMWTVISALTMVGVAAGCSSSGSPGTGTNSGGQPGAAPTCALAPASMVNAALGTNVGDPTSQELGKIVVCTYQAVPGSKGSVILRIQTDMTRATFDSARHISDTNGLPTSDLPGFQDAAYTSVLSGGSVTVNTVVALKGTVQILVSSPATFDAEKALETQLFAKLT